MKPYLFQDNNPFSDTYQQQEQIEKHMMRDPHVSKPGGKILKNLAVHIFRLLSSPTFSYSFKSYFSLSLPYDKENSLHPSDPIKTSSFKG